MLALPLQALADQTRREILSVLSSSPASAGSIANRFELAISTVSHHLSILRLAGLINVRREGRSLIYSMNTEATRQFLAELHALLGVAAEPRAEPGDSG
jgi:DNA-binding transcriptional ArsR family regulator